MMIVSAADERFVAHFAAMLHSAWTHHPTAQFYLMDCGIESGTLADLKEFATNQEICLNILSVDPATLDDLPTTKALSVATYARLLIPDLFPHSVERVLYIDADCIVVNDLTPLWQFDIGSAAIAAVSDIPEVRTEPGRDLDHDSNINAGVMLMNLVIWRHERLASRALDFARKYLPSLCDQPSINFACAGKIAYLPERWNFLLNKPDRLEGWSEPSIVHCAGPKKPWVYSDVPFAPIYLYHRNQTPFAIEPPRTPFRSPLRNLLNLLMGRRKYWNRLLVMRRSRAFTTAYFSRIARATLVAQ
jgi:lipopolysaccharide biosynthesis glycosyltransferase